jgi:hypothetical protein
LSKLLIELGVSQAFELMLNLMELEILFKEVFDIRLFNNPGGKGFLGFLFFFDKNLRCIDLSFFQLVGVNSFGYFWLVLLFLLDILLDVDQGVISLLLIIINLSFLFNLKLNWNLLLA